MRRTKGTTAAMNTCMNVYYRTLELKFSFFLFLFFYVEYSVAICSACIGGCFMESVWRPRTRKYSKKKDVEGFSFIPKAHAIPSLSKKKKKNKRDANAKTRRGWELIW